MPFCTECGTNVSDGIKFCTSCGKVMSAEPPPAAGAWPVQLPPVQQAKNVPPPPPQPPPVQPAPQPVYYQQPAPPPPVYGQPAPVLPPPDGQYAVVSTGSWIGTLILLSIPIVGFILCLVWAFGGGNLNRRNLARACLIFMVIGIVLSIIFGAAMFAMIQSVVGPYMEQIKGAGGGLLDLVE